ncbi:MAG: HAD-IIB family hydrolase [Rhodopirellula sp.]|nr:HAD-IIB family hydrolase [Rhodopirellula sp.]
MEKEYLLISDVDGTLLGDDLALSEFVDWLAPRRERLRVVYNSGRFCKSVMESVRNTQLPTPDAVIGGVGTEIRLYPGEEILDGWPQTAGWAADTVRGTLSGHDGVKLQPEEFLSEHKVSYYLHEATDEQLASIRLLLNSADCPSQVIYSSQRDLDVIPQGVDKGSAARFLARFWNIPAEHVAVSGDTGNDLSMFQQGFRGVVVGNAHEELRSLKGPHIFHATRTHAAGVQEGLSHWFPL